MTPVLELVRQLRGAGVEIMVESGQLKLTAPVGLLTEDLKQALASRKPEILALFADAVALLNERGVRMFIRNGRTVLALWRDADGREVRDAMDALGHVGAEVLHLDDPGAYIPAHYREFVPQYVQRIWAAQGLLATGPQRVAAEAKARFLNALFDDLDGGRTRSRIKGTTVLHGMLKRSQRTS